jgi:long-chain acyl-CoA synthetase
MLFQAIQQHAVNMPNHIAIQDGNNVVLSYQDLFLEVVQSQQTFKKFGLNGTIALAMDNSPAWAVLDIAAIANNMPLVPIPAFFSDIQIVHAIENAGASLLITDNLTRYQALFSHQIQQTSTFMVADKKLILMHLNVAPKSLPNSTAKITYTSGTTGQPKGVCLSEQAMLKVAASIQEMVDLKPTNQHLCVLPLSTLLENVAGLYACLLAGGTTHIMSCEMVGLNGSSLDITKMHQALNKTQANTAIFIPALLSAMVSQYEAGAEKLSALRFLAVGGASVAPSLLLRAQELGLPVFEGYGLSESASVVALNAPTANKIGSVGKPLPHLEIKFSDDNEILVKGANYLGYTNNKNHTQTWLKTGDIGYLDADGYLLINGRKKNMFITSFGRNVSPEWVERDLTSTSIIEQACLFGEAKPWNTALIVAKPNITTAMIDSAIHQINQSLPDYARVSKWLLASEPFTVANQQLTPNGRLKRDTIWKTYQQPINALYI